MCGRTAFIRDVIRSKQEYDYDPGVDEPLLFGKVKIWGEIVEHEEGYRSEFGKIASLDYGDPELLDKFRRIYRVNRVPPRNTFGGAKSVKQSL